MKSLFAGLRHVPKLQHLDVSNNIIGGAVLGLTYETWRSHVGDLVKGLKHVPDLRQLHIQHANLDDNDAQTLADGLQQYVPKLKYLNVSNIDIDSSCDGMKYLRAVCGEKKCVIVNTFDEP